MSMIDDWDKQYREGRLPWDTGRPDPHLVRVVSERPVAPGRALEVGCGTGTNAIWLAAQGFEVVASDVSPTALATAEDKSEAAGQSVTWYEGSFPDGMPPFDLVFDRGCWHIFDQPAERARFAAHAAAALVADGLWISLLGSTDGPPRDHGPPRRSALDIAAAAEPHFEILSLESDFFEADIPSPARAWIALLRRRKRY